MPTWFAVGPEVPGLEDARALQATPLALGDEPRWFTGFPRVDTAADRARAGELAVREARLEATGEGGRRLVPTVPPFPRLLEELARKDQGTTLELQVRRLAMSGDLELRLELRAGARAVWRETEHRWTNTVPILIGLYAGGEPVRRTWQGSAKFGGISRFVKLAEPGASWVWVLRVTKTSVQRLLGDLKPKRLEVVAAFSERQHAGYARPGYAMPLDVPERPFAEEQIVVRSNVAAVDWR